MTKDRRQPTSYQVGFNYLAPYLDGVYLAVNAMPDTYLIYDAHDCGYNKAEKIAGNHDLFSSLMRWDKVDRIVRTNLESREFIMGSDDRLSMRLRQIAERYSPNLIFIARSNVMIFTGHDVEQVISELDQKLTTPLARIPESHADRDHICGFLDCVAEILAKLEPSAQPRHEKRVLVAGYVFERHEGDHKGNVAEIDRILTGIGALTGPILLDGNTFESYQQLEPADLVVDLASDWQAAREFSSRTGADYIQTTLPVGLEGTCNWIRSLASSLKLESQAEEFIDAELSQLAPMLQWLLPRFFLGRTAIIFADRQWIRPLVLFLEELGLRISALACSS
ncbi:MAG: hypothetical protein JRJ87_27585, partial [Deltaproteobacteria bacterium]|nr:hypothetical protein [Deltaproteobacteria bacterium]